MGQFREAANYLNACLPAIQERRAQLRFFETLTFLLALGRNQGDQMSL
jgi:hypothetical protein